MTKKEMTAAEGVAEDFVGGGANAQGAATPSLAERVKHLIEGTKTHRAAVDVAMAAIIKNKADTDNQYAVITGQVVEAVALFQADPEAADKFFQQKKVKCRRDTANVVQYLTAKCLMGNGRGGGPISKIATVAAGMGTDASTSAVERINLLGGFAKAYEHFKPKNPQAADDNEKFVGAELVIRLRDGSAGILPVSPNELVRLGTRKMVTWLPADDNTNVADVSGNDGEDA